MKSFIQLCLMLGLVLSFSTDAKAQPILTIDTIIHATCNASANGQIQISVAGTPPFTYAWSNGATTEDLTGLFSGSYVVTVTDGLSGVTVSSVLNVNAPPLLNVNTDTVYNISCAGDTNGGVDITVFGGVPGYTYLWDNGATTQDVTGLGAGPVNLTVTDANGCTSSSKSIFLDSIPSIFLTIDSIQNITCNAANNAFINITASGGVGNFSYLWSSGQMTDDISGLAVGMYTVTATDSNGCALSSGPHNITQPGVLTITLDSIQDLLCNADGDGGVYISVAGGTMPYTYTWSNGGTTEDITGLNGDTYFVTVTDSLGCQTTSGPHIVNEPSTILVVVDTIINQLCAGVPSGAVDLSVSGGTPGYTYIWGNGEITQDVSGLYSGVNDVTVTDANGCTASAKSIFLDTVPAIIITLDSIIDVTCNGDNDGGVYISVTGGTGGVYDYLWSTGATTADLTGLSGGSYSVTVTDSNSCVLFSGPHLVNEPATLVVTFDSLHHIDCNGDGDGAVFITTTGGTTNYSYAWSNGMTTEDITGLGGGAYSVTVTDANGCVDSTGPHVVNEPAVLTLTLDSIHHISCNGNGNGAVFISVTGGTTAYTYAWDNAMVTQDIMGLNGGTYVVTVTDAQGCSVTDTAYVVNEPAVLTIALDSIIDVSCNGFGDGGVFVTTTGGTTNYNFTWSNGATTEDNTGLGGGNYTLTVTDANGCSTTSGPHNVNEPAGMTITLDTIIHVSCNAAADGEVQISVSGGAPTYTYAWSNGATTEDIMGLNGDSYTVTVTDANGCTLSDGPHDVMEDSLLVITLDTISNVSCNTAADGYINITASGGVPTYTYAWSNTAVTQNISGLSGGSYTITVTDASGCTATDTAYVVNEPTPLAIVLDSVGSVCNGVGADIMITVSGGTVNYSYAWSNGLTTEDIVVTTGGNYTVTVTDANGCTLTGGPYNVLESMLAPIITADASVICDGNLLDSILSDMSGSTGFMPYVYDWTVGGSSFATTQHVTGLAAGTYVLIVTDSTGCTASSNAITIAQLPPVTITADSIMNVSCNGGNDGFINISVGGAAGVNDTYLWSNAAMTQDISGLSAGDYTVTVTTIDGCIEMDTFTVMEPQVLAITLDSIQHVDCNGINIGAVYISVTGGTTAYSFNWDNGLTTEDITGLSGGAYAVTVTDANGCVDSTGPHIINEPTALAIALDSIHHVTCNGAADGAVFVSTTGGTPGYLFAWDNGLTTEDITGLNGGTYSLTVTDANGCTLTHGPDSVGEPAVLMVVIDTFKNESCFGIVDGFINTSAAGGTAPFSFMWSNGATTDDITGLLAGTYTVTITDSNSCVAIDSVTINDIPTTTITLGLIDSVSCNGLSDGAIDVTTTLGAPSYSWLWSNGATSEDIAGLAIGSFSVTVTDSLGCVITSGPFDVFQPDVLTITLDNITDVTCNGAADGAVTMTTAGGTLTYNYVWTNGMTTEDIAGLSGSTNAVTVTDMNGCSATSGPHVVNEDPAIVITLDNITHVSCNGAADGAVMISVAGGVAGYTYNWDNNGGNAQDATALSGNDYSVTVTDAVGCTMTSGAHTVNEPTALTLSTTPTVPLEGCLGEAIGQIDATAAGGTSPLTYAWSNGANTASNTGLNTGNYGLTVTDGNGCTITGLDSILNPLRPTVFPFVGQSPITDTTINWNDVIAIDAGNNQSAQGVSYAWVENSMLGNVNFDDASASSTTVNPQPTTPGTYTLFVTATSGDGCVDTGSITITVTIDEFIGMPNAFSPNGDMVNDYYRPAKLDDQFILEFKVFNRWGQLIHDHTDTTAGWDGTYKGVDQPREVYIYLLRYQTPGADEVILKGEFTLIR